MHQRFWVRGSLAAAALAALGAFYWLGLTSVAGQVHDDVVYLVTGKALAENLGYRIISMPGDPLQIGYPPLYPALLALIWKLAPAFPANLWAFKSLNIVCALVSLVLTYRLAVKAYGAPRWQGWLTAGLLGLSSFYFNFMDMTMSEPFFMVVLLGALLLLERLPEAKAGTRPWAPAALAVAATLPAMVRSIGITLMGGLALWLLLRRQWKLAAGTIAGLGLAYLPWVVWGAYAKRVASTSWDYVSWASAGTSGFGLGALLSNLVHNGSAILTTSIPLSVAPLLFHDLLLNPLRAVGLAGAASLLGLAVTCVVLAGLVRLGSERLRLLHVFLAAYVGLILIYPWDPTRFMAALSPLLIFAFVRGATWLADAAPRAARWRAGAGWGLVALCVVLAGGAGLARAASFARHQAFHDALLPPTVQTQQADQQALLRWSETHVPENGLWVHRRDPLLYLLTGRKAISYADGPEPAPPRKELFRKHPAFMLVYPDPDEQFTTHRALLKAHPERVSLVFKPPGGTFEVYRLSQDWPN